VTTGLTGPQMLGGEYRMLLPVPGQLNGPYFTINQLAGEVRDSIGPAVVASFVGEGSGATAAQQAVADALSMDAGMPAGTGDLGPPIPQGGHVHGRPATGHGTGDLERSSSVTAAARRFAALPLAARRVWLRYHLTALRAGHITLAQLP
jgi:hypothetical protein